MFDLTSSKLLILAVVALLVVGPKDLPALLRTVGRYMGMIRRQANEFRAQFEDAMRETELAELKKEVEDLGRDTKATLSEATRTVETHLGDVDRELALAATPVDTPAPPLNALESSADATGSASDRDLLPDPGAVEPEPSLPEARVLQAPPAAQPRPQPRATADALTGAPSGGA